MSGPNENVLRPPNVPTPDWSIESKNTISNTNKTPDQRNSFPDHNQKQEINDHCQKQEIRDPPALKMTNSNDDNAHLTPQRPNSQSIIGSTSSHSMASRITGDVALTPTNVHTPMFTNVNPHSTMTAMTPAASGADQAKNSIKLQNCVSSVSLGCELRLLEIYCRTRYSEYNPARFQGVVMKIIDPRATALVFRSGKIVCTGARTEHDSYLAARKFARIIHKLGYPVRFLDFKIQNFCATADLRFPVRLEALQQAHGQFASYEPELFPGLVYRMVRPRVVLLIFVSGKVVFTGGRSRNEIVEALDIIYPILRSYRIS